MEPATVAHPLDNQGWACPSQLQSTMVRLPLELNYASLFLNSYWTWLRVWKSKCLRKRNESDNSQIPPTRFCFLIQWFHCSFKTAFSSVALLGYLFQEDTSTCWITVFMQSLGLCYLSSLWSSSWLYCSFIELKSNFRGVASSVMLPLCCPSILWTLPCHFPWETFFSLPGPPLNYVFWKSIAECLSWCHVSAELTSREEWLEEYPWCFSSSSWRSLVLFLVIICSWPFPPHRPCLSASNSH